MNQRQCTLPRQHVCCCSCECLSKTRDALRKAEIAEEGVEACAALARLLEVANNLVDEVSQDTTPQLPNQIYPLDRLCHFSLTLARSVALRASYVLPMQVSAAPEPRDVITIIQSSPRTVGAFSAFKFIQFVLSFVAALLDTACNFLHHSPSLRCLRSNFILNATLTVAGRSRELLQGFLPTLAITVSMAVLPFILSGLATSMLRPHQEAR